MKNKDNKGCKGYKEKWRMYGMIYRARRKGSDITTRERTINRDYRVGDASRSRQECVLMGEYGFGMQLIF